VAGDYSWLKVGVRADTSQMERDIRTSAVRTGESAGSSISGHIGGALKSVAKIGALGALAAGGYGVAKAVGFAKTSVVDFNSTLQQSNIAFTTMLGSGAKAKKFTGDLQAFAAKTPFEFEGLRTHKR
jgi:hypothetical protein